MTGSKLKLNLSKIFIGMKLHRCLILGQDTNPSALATYLGVTLSGSITLLVDFITLSESIALSGVFTLLEQNIRIDKY